MLAKLHTFSLLGIDLPITLGVLAGSGQLASERFEDYAVVGELSLEGRTRPAKGALSMAISAARQRNLRGIEGEKVSGLFSDRSLFGRVLLWDDQNGRMRLAVFIML